MSETVERLQPTLPLRKMEALRASWLPLLLNWLIPGLGFWRTGDRRRGSIFMAVWAIFLTIGYFQLSGGIGNGMPGGIYVLTRDSYLQSCGALATLGVGPIYFLFAHFFGGVGSEPVRNLIQEYGATYVMVAGVLNWLTTFDLFDRVTQRWIWRLPKDEVNFPEKQED